MKPAAILDGLLARSPAQPIFSRRASGRLAVLAYHGVDDADRFARQLDLIGRAARPLTLDEALDVIAGRRAPPPHAVLVTFDDGDMSVLDVAMPLLREREIPAVAFVVAGLIDSDRPVWWREVRQLVGAGASARGLEGLDGDEMVRALKRVPDERRLATLTELRHSNVAPASPARQLRTADLRALEKAGIAVGNHSLTHACLDRCGEQKIRFEIEESDEILKNALGHSPRAFAYPNGDRDRRVEQAVAQAGYEAAFLFDHRLARVPARDPRAVSRVRVNSTDGMNRFRTVLSGLHPAVHALRTAGSARGR